MRRALRRQGAARDKEWNMANITRTDPFRELARFDPFREMEGFAWPRLRRLFTEVPEEPTIKLDVTEDDKAYFVKAELPGVRKEDISVEIEDNQVCLAAEVKREKEEKKGETVVHSERFFGRQYRAFTLPMPIDRATAEAKFADGVLSLTLPKNNPAPTQRIAIQ
jgi:HSP20 family protein